MSDEDRIAHCRTRIRQEERAALCAGNDAAQRAHAELAQLYRRLETVLVRPPERPPLASGAVSQRSGAHRGS